MSDVESVHIESENSYTSQTKKQHLGVVFNIVGLYACYLASTVIQEKLYGYRSEKEDISYGDKFESGALLTFTKSLMTVIVSRMMIFIRGFKREPIYGKSAVSSALLRSFGTIFSLYSLNFISYPYSIIGKSMKIVPVFIADVTFNKKKASYMRCMSVFVTTVGMLLFSSENMKKNNGMDNSLIGICLILLSLCTDGALSICQNTMMSGDGDPEKKPNALDTMIYMSSWQSFISFIMVLNSFADRGGIMFCFQNQIVFKMLLVSSTIESFGQFFVYSLVVSHGTFMTAFVTTLRKFATILISIGLFGHVLTSIQWISVIMVFLGVSLDLFGSNWDKKNKISYSEVPTILK
jgi:solute carrier family 35 (UDP-galactose transporter), member B1